MVRHGWTYVSTDSDGTQNWCRPGKSTGVSATVNYAGNDLLHVFSTNAPQLEANQSYSKFAFITALEHEGDFTAAARALAPKATVAKVCLRGAVVQRPHNAASGTVDGAADASKLTPLLASLTNPAFNRSR